MWRCAVLLGLLHRGTKATPSQNPRCDGSPSLLAHPTEWINLVDMQTRFPLVVSGALHTLNGEEVKVPSMPCTILPVGSE
jgi:hypothetical protein